MYLFEDLRATPELSFAVKHLNCHCGIVLTASHNPPEYNGYKLKGSYGGPMLSEQVDEIEAIIPSEHGLNLDNIKLDINENLFHAGTTKKDNKIYATGGRVLNFVSISDNRTTAKQNIIKNLDKLNWTGGFYRKDIGYKVID